MDGILVINKETNYTSRDVVNVVSKKFKTKKVGHTGTLDPLATGVLVICLNNSTKLVDYLTNHDKDYEVTVKLGISTDTLDVTGKVLKEEESTINEEQLVNVLNTFNKTYLQEVPIYSAVKINGKKLYEYARNNMEVELPKREVSISNIKLLSFKGDSFSFSCTVSKGTYIRSLIKDICSELGVIGVMASLNRTRVGNFKIADSVSLDDVSNNDITSIEEVLKDIKEMPDIDNLAFKVMNGQKIVFDDYTEEYLKFMMDNKVKAIYKRDINNIYRMYKYFQ